MNPMAHFGLYQSDNHDVLIDICYVKVIGNNGTSTYRPACNVKQNIF